MSLGAWHSLNQRLPNDDAANYAFTAVDVYSRLGSGVLAGVTNLYFDRGWRPIIFPDLAVPFLCIFGGNVRLAVAGTLLASTVALFVYTYLLLRPHLPWQVSLLVSGSVLGLPWIQLNGAVFYAELPSLAAVAAAVYYWRQLGKAPSVQNGLAFGLTAGIAIDLRPIEPIPLVFTLVCVAVVLGVRRGWIGRRELSWAFVIAGFCGMAVAARFVALERSRLESAALLLAVLAASGIVARRACMNAPFVAGWLALVGTVAIWYGPFAKELYEWIYETTAGNMMQLYRGRTAESLVDAAQLYFGELGGWRLALLALVVAGIASLRLFQGRQPFEGGPLAALGLMQIALVVGAAAWLGGGDLRRGYFGFYLLFIGLYALASGGDRAGGAPKVFAICGIAGWQLLASLSLGSLPAGPAVYWPVILPRAVPAPSVTADTSYEVFEWLEGEILQKDAVVASFSLAENSYERRVFDPFALNVVAASKRSDLRFGYPWDFLQLENGYAQLRNFQFVLLDGRDTFPEIPAAKLQQPTSRLTLDLQQRARTGMLAEVGWGPRSTRQIGATPLILLEAVR